MKINLLRFAKRQTHARNTCLFSGNISQIFKNTLCLVLLLAATQDHDLLGTLALGLAVSLPVPIGLYLLLRHG